jgi:methionyl-tRNA formyltransferase
MGTPWIAAECLKTLIADRQEILAVFTQPDRPKGRGMKLAKPEVKLLAEERGIPVFQPKKLKKSMEIIEELAPELIVVVAYGRLLPKVMLDYPRYGCVNLHASLLPRLRGAAPIQRAIVNGDTVGGVTTMYMAEELDAGDVIFCEETEISNSDTGGSLTEKYAGIGGKLLVKTIKAIEEGSVKAIPQDGGRATFAPPIGKEEARIDWTGSAEEIRNLIRGFNPAPAAFTTLGGQQLKVFAADSLPETGGAHRPGEVIAVLKNGLEVSAGKGRLVITEVQAAGKKRMNAGDWLRGKRIEPGTVLGE